MNAKQANWAETFGTSATVGGGAFAIGALIQEINRQREAEAQRKRQQLPANALVIDMPRPAQKTAEDGSASFLKSANELIANTLALLAGAPAGFIGAKTIYDTYKKKQTDHEINDANLKYMQTLQALQQKTAELNTPLVDQLCKAAAEELVKSAASLGSVAPWLAKAAPWAVGGAGGLKIVNDLGGFDWAKNRPDPSPSPGALGSLWGSAKNAWGTLAILTALGGAGAMVHANNKKNERENKNVPSAVALNYEDIPPAPVLQHE